MTPRELTPPEAAVPPSVLLEVEPLEPHGETRTQQWRCISACLSLWVGLEMDRVGARTTLRSIRVSPRKMMKPKLLVPHYPFKVGQCNRLMPIGTSCHVEGDRNRVDRGAGGALTIAMC